MDVKIVKKEVSAEHYLLIVQGAMLRGEFMVPYFVARIAAKEPKDKTITTMSLSGTAKRLDRFGQIFERLIGSYERRFPKTAPVATAPATPTSKPVKSR